MQREPPKFAPISRLVPPAISSASINDASSHVRTVATPYATPSRQNESVMPATPSLSTIGTSSTANLKPSTSVTALINSSSSSIVATPVSMKTLLNDSKGFSAELNTRLMSRIYHEKKRSKHKSQKKIIPLLKQIQLHYQRQVENLAAVKAAVNNFCVESFSVALEQTKAKEQQALYAELADIIKMLIHNGADNGLFSSYASVKQDLVQSIFSASADALLHCIENLLLKNYNYGHVEYEFIDRLIDAVEDEQLKAQQDMNAENSANTSHSALPIEALQAATSSAAKAAKKENLQPPALYVFANEDTEFAVNAVFATKEHKRLFFARKYKKLPSLAGKHDSSSSSSSSSSSHNNNAIVFVFMREDTRLDSEKFKSLKWKKLQKLAGNNIVLIVTASRNAHIPQADAIARKIPSGLFLKTRGKKYTRVITVRWQLGFDSGTNSPREMIENGECARVKKEVDELIKQFIELRNSAEEDESSDDDDEENDSSSDDEGDDDDDDDGEKKKKKKSKKNKQMFDEMQE